MGCSDPVSLAAIGRADLPAVGELLREPWPGVDWERRFERQWRDNPAWNEQLAMGWAHRTDDGIVSFFGSVPIAYWIGGRADRAFAATALYVRRSLRGRGLARELVRAWLGQTGGRLWINSTSNDISAGIFEGLELREKRREQAEREALVVARPFAYARGAAARRLRGKALPGLLQLPLAVAGGAALWWRRPREPRDSRWSWQRLAEAGRELDALWERERPADRATLQRDSRTLHWLYFAGPKASDNHLLIGRDGKGTARALAGFHREKDPSLLRQLDLFGTLDDSAWPALVSAASRLAVEQGIDVVRFWSGDEESCRALAELGLELRPGTGAVYYQASDPSELASEPLFTDLDGDRCLELLL